MWCTWGVAWKVSNARRAIETFALNHIMPMRNRIIRD